MRIILGQSPVSQIHIREVLLLPTAAASFGKTTTVNAAAQNAAIQINVADETWRHIAQGKSLKCTELHADRWVCCHAGSWVEVKAVSLVEVTFVSFRQGCERVMENLIVQLSHFMHSF